MQVESPSFCCCVRTPVIQVRLPIERCCGAIGMTIHFFEAIQHRLTHSTGRQMPVTIQVPMSTRCLMVSFQKDGFEQPAQVMLVQPGGGGGEEIYVLYFLALVRATAHGEICLSGCKLSRR